MSGTSLSPNFSVVSWKKARWVGPEREGHGSYVLSYLPISSSPIVIVYK